MVLFSMLIVACGGGGGSVDFSEPLPSDPLPDAAVGGAWIGTDSFGNDVIALSTDSGRLHWLLPDTGEQGFGTVSVQSRTTTIEFTYVAPPGFTLDDGSASATCAGGGLIGEREILNASITCSTSLGGTYENFVPFVYDPLYDRDSSLAQIAGNYDDAGQVINITAEGEVFAQNPVTGCIINGQIAIIDSQFNAYDLSISYSSCIGDAANLNGSTFAGLGMLDDSVAPESAVVGLTGDIGGQTYSMVYVLTRL